MIEGVEFIPTNVISDSRGRIAKYIRVNSDWFCGFDLQEIYFSIIYPGVIKGWHKHSDMTLNYFVPMGDIKLVLFDARSNSSTRFFLEEIYLGEHATQMIVRIPPGIWNGFMAVGNKDALVANATNFVHSKDEIQRMTPKEFSDNVYVYDWFASNFR